MFLLLDPWVPKPRSKLIIYRTLPHERLRSKLTHDLSVRSGWFAPRLLALVWSWVSVCRYEEKIIPFKMLRSLV